MVAFLDRAVLYPPEIGRAELERIVAGAAAAAGSFDRVEFAAEDGGTEARELAVPRLPAMDEIEVERAAIHLRAVPGRREVTGYRVEARPAGADRGIVLVLPTARRLVRFDMGYPVFPQAVRNEAAIYGFLGGKVVSREGEGLPVRDLRLVLRPSLTEAPPFEFAPPAYAAPDFGRPGPLYPPTLGGLAVTDLANGRFKAGLAGLRGSAWLVQLAHGDAPEDLTPVAFDAPVLRVEAEAAPANLSVTLAGAGGDVLLWSHPDALPPETGEHEVAFTPLAQAHLAAQLGDGATDRGPTLALPLRFRSDAGGAIELTRKTLSARYRVRPLGAEPRTVRVGGHAAALELAAPAGLRPAGSRLRWTVRHLGRELNDPARLAAEGEAQRGLRVGASRRVATAVAVRARPGTSEAEPVPLVAARVRVAAPADAELVAEFRADAAGSPGELAAEPVVRQLAAGTADWLELPLAAPLPVVPGGAPLWIVLRTNRGEVNWFAAAGAPAGEPSRVSVDGGASWGRTGEPLHAASGLTAQLYHAVAEPLPRPVVEFRVDGVTATPDLLAGGDRISPREFAHGAAELPAGVLDRLARPGAPLARLDLLSTAVAELTLVETVLFYAPDPAGSVS